MVRTASLVVALLLGPFVANARADRRDEAKAQVDFGIRVAQAGLWQEATYRFERAVEIDPSYANAYNNLAVAYEQAGEVDKARAAYEKALQLQPKNRFIIENYDLFREIHDRATNRGGD